MAKKEPRDAEPESVRDPSDARRQRFANWVQGVQHKAHSTRAVSTVPSSIPPPATEVRRTIADSERPSIYHQLPEDIALLDAVRAERLANAAPSSSPIPPPPSSRPEPHSRPGPPSSPPTSSRITAPTPVAAWDPGSLAYREDLPPDELTAVFAPPPELLARSGAHRPAPGTWEEPTQVVDIGDMLENPASTRSDAPPSHPPSPEQVAVERELPSLAPPAEWRRGRWLFWALITLLIGAAAAVLLEYSLHPSRM